MNKIKLRTTAFLVFLACAIAQANPAHGASDSTSAVINFSTSASKVAVNSPEFRLVIRAEVADPSGISRVEFLCGDINVSLYWPIDSSSAYFVSTLAGKDLPMRAPTAPIFGDPRDFKIVAGFYPTATVYPYNCIWFVNITNRQAVKTTFSTGISTTLIDSTSPESTNSPLVVKPKFTKSQLTKFAKKRYANCAALKKYFPYGLAFDVDAAFTTGMTQAEDPFISKNGYQLNRKLDRDRDNVACEL